MDDRKKEPSALSNPGRPSLQPASISGSISEPLVSICIPANHAAENLREALAGIRSQTFEKWELIVVDAGSSGEIETIVRNFRRSVPQSVSFERFSEGGNVVAALNVGISRARGRHVAILVPGSTWTPDHLQVLAKCSADTGADLVHSGVAHVCEETSEHFDARSPSEQAINQFPRSLFLGKYEIDLSSVLFTRDLWKKIGGFDESCCEMNDPKFWLRMVQAHAHFSRVQAITCRQYCQKGAEAEPISSLEAKHDGNENMKSGPRRSREGAENYFSAGRIPQKDDQTHPRDYFGRALQRSAGSPHLLAYWFAATVGALSKQRNQCA